MKKHILIIFFFIINLFYCNAVVITDCSKCDTILDLPNEIKSLIINSFIESANLIELKLALEYNKELRNTILYYLSQNKILPLHWAFYKKNIKNLTDLDKSKILNVSKNIIYVALNSKIQTYDLNSGKFVPFEESADSVSNFFIKTFTISKDETLFVGQSSKQIKIWEINSGKCVYRLNMHYPYVKDLVISNNNTYLAGRVPAGPVIVWDIKSQTKLLTLHNAYIVDNINKELDTILYLQKEDDYKFKLCDLNSDKVFILYDKFSEILMAKISNDHKYLFTLHYQTIKVWELSDNNISPVYVPNTDLNNLNLLSNNDFISKTDNFSINRVENQTLITKPLKVLANKSKALNGTFFIFVGEAGKLVLYNIKRDTYLDLCTENIPIYHMTNTTISLDKNFISMVINNKMILVWDSLNGDCVYKIQNLKLDELYEKVWFSQNNKSIIIRKNTGIEIHSLNIKSN